MPGLIPWRRRSSAVRSPHPVSGLEGVRRRACLRTALIIRPCRRCCQSPMGPLSGVQLESSLHDNTVSHGLPAWPSGVLPGGVCHELRLQHSGICLAKPGCW